MDLNKININSPKCCLLTNGKFSSIVSDSGIGFIKENNILLSRHRKSIVSGIYGNFLYVEDTSIKKFYSVSLAPMFQKIKKQECEIFENYVRFVSEENSIEITLDVFVSESNAEIRKVKVKNFNKWPVELNFTTYIEVTLTEKEADSAHMVFSNLFVETEYKDKVLFAKRRPRNKNSEEYKCFSKIISEDLCGISYETDRNKFIGRGNFITNPISLKNEKLSNTVGCTLDPILSFKFPLNIEAFSEKEFSIITGFMKDDETLDNLNSMEKINILFENLKEKKCEENINKELCSRILSNSFFNLNYDETKQTAIKNNNLCQRDLWKHGISGDKPIILLDINSENDILKEVFTCFKYLIKNGIVIDLVILKNKTEVLEPDQNVFIIDKNTVENEFVELLFKVSSLKIDDKTSIESQIKETFKIENNYDSKTFSDNSPDYDENEQFIRKNLKFFNGYGGYNGDSEYVIIIKNGKVLSVPFSNVISNQNFGFIIDDFGKGYTWAFNSRENKITPWYNDIVSDFGGEKIYILDESKNNVSSPFYLSENSKNTNHIVRHGLGYSKFETKTKDLNETLTSFVAVNDPVKFFILKVENISNISKSLLISHIFKPIISVDDEKISSSIEITNKDNLFMINNKYNSDYNETSFLYYSEELFDFSCDETEIYGNSRGHIIPKAVYEKSLSGKIIVGNVGVCSRFFLNIEPNSQKEIFIITGQCNKEDIDKLLKKYKNLESVKNEFDNVTTNWNDVTSKITVKTPSEETNLILNKWLVYQILSSRIFTRGSYYQSGGAYGFRDQLQDILGIVEFFEELSRHQILKHAHHQFKEGDVLHWWHENIKLKNVANKGKKWEINDDFDIGKGIRTKFSDDLLWLVYSTLIYIEKTNDYNILDENIPFIESELLEGVDEKYLTPALSETGTLYEHCLRAIKKTKYGKHNIPLMGSGDWNDGMNTVGNKGLGESVFVGWFLYSILDKFIPIAKYKNDEKIVNEFTNSKEKLKVNMDQTWDGEWYLRAFFDNGETLGSKNNDECKIDLISQAWAAFSECGDPKKVKKAIESAITHLVDFENSLVKLLTPPFKNTKLEPGYIKGYVWGVRENGGQYTHAATWLIYALVSLKKYNEAFQIFEILNPINHSKTEEKISKYKVEPYVVSADVYSNSEHMGRGGWSWYTGSAAWLLRSGLEEILGIKKRGKYLLIVPKIPKDWKEYEIYYRENNFLIFIKVLNPDSKNTLKEPFKIDLETIKSDKEIEIILDT